MESEQEKKNKNKKLGCPCQDNCCDKPKIFTPEHICDESICEKCYMLECRTCEKSCTHEL